MPGHGEVVELLSADPDLGADLDVQDAERARRTVLAQAATVEAGREDILVRRTDHPGLVGFFVLEGLLLREIEVAGTVAAELVGSGDVIHPGDLRDSDLSPLRGHLEWSVLAPARIAILDAGFVSRAAPWPQVLGRIALRAVWRTQGLALSLAISHRTRVEDRLLLLFWHLAHRFGRVGTTGVRLDLPLTHTTLGKLIGAQRPSVTTALGVLGDRNLLVREERDMWLLPQPMPDELEPLLSGRAVRERAEAAPASGTSAP
jgi:CRP/FNR family cyclic AMP-dependent transcriptional regulator